MLINLVKIVLAGLLPILALPQDNPITTERIDPSVEFVEGEGLPFDSRAYGLVSFLTTATNMSTGGGGIGGSSSEITGLRILIFSTQPGERLTFNMKSDQSKVMMAVYPDEKAAKLKGAFRAANSPFATTRAKKLVFTNTSKEPYDVSLILYGTHGYRYHMTWESKAKK